MSSSIVRKSRPPGKPSLLPKPRRVGSIDRQSTDANRPSAAGCRSSSADPPRHTLVGRQSNMASATKPPLNAKRSRSQTGGPETRYDIVTPLRQGNQNRGSQYNTMTPSHSGRNWMTSATPDILRTPNKDKINWQDLLERALAFVTAKDMRPISNNVWQRSECARMNECLTQMELGGLIRPLTIARFVEIVNQLLKLIVDDPKLNNDNYVAKLPHMMKRLLYPGTISKSWLKTVNTLHAFPQALALIAYLYDLATDLNKPVTMEWLYMNKDDITRLRRDYIFKCWICFNNKTDHHSKGENETELLQEYLSQFKELVGYDDHKIGELQQHVAKLKAQDEENSEELAVELEKKAQVSARHAHVSTELKAIRSETKTLDSRQEAEDRKKHSLPEARRALELEVERHKNHLAQLQSELSTQKMSVEERNRLLDNIDFSRRVTDSKWAIADEVHKKVVSKENEMALWQRRALDACVRYKGKLIQLAPALAHLRGLAVDETELMSEECVERMNAAVSALRAEQSALAARRNERARTRAEAQRRNAQREEELYRRIAEIKASNQREQEAINAEKSTEAAEAGAWSQEEKELQRRYDELRHKNQHYAHMKDDLRRMQSHYNERKEAVSQLTQRIETLETQNAAVLRRARDRRATLMRDFVRDIRDHLTL